MPLVALLSSGTTQAREFAAGALWHLALDKSNQSSIARFNGISPLVTILDDGTEQAHKHAAAALARLARVMETLHGRDIWRDERLPRHIAALGIEGTGTPDGSPLNHGMLHHLIKLTQPRFFLVFAAGACRPGQPILLRQPPCGGRTVAFCLRRVSRIFP